MNILREVGSGLLKMFVADGWLAAGIVAVVSVAGLLTKLSGAPPLIGGAILFLGCNAVLARSFARIHETNLKKQGILPLTFADPKDYDKIEMNDRLSIVDLAHLAPSKPVTVVIHKTSGDVKIQANHSMTAQQLTWFKAGSALNALN